MADEQGGRYYDRPGFSEAHHYDSGRPSSSVEHMDTAPPPPQLAIEQLRNTTTNVSSGKSLADLLTDVKGITPVIPDSVAQYYMQKYSLVQKSGFSLDAFMLISHLANDDRYKPQEKWGLPDPSVMAQCGAVFVGLGFGFYRPPLEHKKLGTVGIVIGLMHCVGAFVIKIASNGAMNGAAEKNSRYLSQNIFNGRSVRLTPKEE